MSALVPLLVSAAVAALIAPRCLRALPRRPNWRGLALPFPAGAIAPAAAGAAAAILAAAGRPPDAAVLALGGGVALLGLLDDLLDAPPRGWRGHAAAVRRGELSTGALKAVGTAALALAATGGDLLATAAIVLAAHVFNVLDLRPGRSIKAFVLLGAALLAATRALEPLGEIGVFAGALLVLGLYDLRERAMLGDTGSTLLGALAGLWLTAALDTGELAGAVAIMVVIALYAEVSSLSALIDRMPPLLVLDWLGRRKPDA
jgi:UDP-GlcNAc:undecaprenyl-phosphate/decaprenyl-phosphate GlcNAc-1-phosphate transferase